MIPKIIHYCWISNESMDVVKKFTDTWKKTHGDYTFIKWDYDKVMSIPNLPLDVIDAINTKRYAFAADFVRQYAVYEYGGWYMDCDVYCIELFMNLYENNEFVCAIEDSLAYYGKELLNESIDSDGNNICDGYVYGIGIQAACFGGERHNVISKAVLEYYYSHKFYDDKTSEDKSFPIAPQLMARAMEQFGFKYKQEYQKLDHGIVLYGKFPNPNEFNALTLPHAIHCCRGSWRLNTSNHYN